MAPPPPTMAKVAETATRARVKLPIKHVSRDIHAVFTNSELAYVWANLDLDMQVHTHTHYKHHTAIDRPLRPIIRKHMSLPLI